MKRMLGILIFCAGFLFIINSASAAPVDFSTFTFTGGADIIDDGFGGDVLVFDEYYGSSNMYVKNLDFYVSGPNLKFDYYLAVTSMSEDYLFVDINYDNVTDPDFEVGGRNSSTVWGDNDIYEGSVLIDMTNIDGINYVGKTISLTFGFESAGLDEIDSFDYYGDSYGEIYNVSIPEPATLLLLGTCLIGLAGIGRRKL